MNACDDLATLYTRRLLGTLEEDELDAVEAHLADCGPCERLTDDLEAALAAAELPEAPPTAGVLERVEAELAADPAPAPSADGPAVRVALSCTFCRARLDPSGSVYCASCLAPHHAVCFEEHGRCCASGCDGVRVVAAAAPGPAPARRSDRLGPLGIAVLGAGALVAAALVAGDLAGDAGPPPRAAATGEPAAPEPTPAPGPTYEGRSAAEWAGQLHDWNAVYREEALGALTVLGADALPHLRRAAEAGPPADFAAARALEQLDPDYAAPLELIEGALDDPDRSRFAVAMLEGRSDPAAVALLGRAAGGEFGLGDGLAVDAIRELDPAARGPALAGLARLTLQVSVHADAALEALAATPGPEARALLVELAADAPRADVREAALEALLERPAGAPPELLGRLLDDTDRAIRERVLELAAAGENDDARAVPLLLRALDDPQDHLALGAARALADRGRAAATGPGLVALLERDPSSRSVAEAAELLLALDAPPPSAAGPLVDALLDGDRIDGVDHRAFVPALAVVRRLAVPTATIVRLLSGPPAARAAAAELAAARAPDLPAAERARLAQELAWLLGDPADARPLSARGPDPSTAARFAAARGLEAFLAAEDEAAATAARALAAATADRGAHLPIRLAALAVLERGLRADDRRLADGAAAIALGDTGGLLPWITRGSASEVAPVARLLDADARAALEVRLDPDSPAIQARWVAARLLLAAEPGHEAAGRALVQALHETRGPEDQARLLDWVAGLALEPARPAVAALLVHAGDDHVRERAARALAALGGEDAVARLQRALAEDPGPGPRAAAARALGALGAHEALFAARGDPSPFVRLEVASALLAADPGPEARAAWGAAKDAALDFGVSTTPPAVFEALALRDDPEALALLRARLEDDPRFAAADDAVLLEALATLGPAAAAAELDVARLSHRLDAEVGPAARTALRAIRGE